MNEDRTCPSNKPYHDTGSAHPQHIQRAAKRIYGIAEFRFYAIADGIK